MSRIQLALNVDDLEQAITFYSTLFDTEPAKRKPGYANFAIADPPLKLVLLENTGQGGTLNHLGIEVESSEQVHGEIARLSRAGMFTEAQIATTCCFATQDKVWATGPNAEKWEVYTVLADTETFGTAMEFAEPSTARQTCCDTGDQAAENTCCNPAAGATTQNTGHETDPDPHPATGDSCCDTDARAAGVDCCESDARAAGRCCDTAEPGSSSHKSCC